MTNNYRIFSKHYNNNNKESVHYASTPTLFYPQQLHQQQQRVNHQKFHQQTFHHQQYKSTLYLHPSDNSVNSSEVSDLDLDESAAGQLRLSFAELKTTESALKGHKSRIFVCKCLANLYTCPKVSPSSASAINNSTCCKKNNSSISNTATNWRLKFTGIPVLLHDLGNTRQRNKRQIQIFLVEKGTGFVLWKDVIDHLTKYQISQDTLFHTMHLSTDHSRRIGLSFDAVDEAGEFHQRLVQLTSVPANISLSGPSTRTMDPLQVAIIEEANRYDYFKKVLFTTFIGKSARNLQKFAHFHWLSRIKFRLNQ
jgi:hypothetical protein